MSKTYFVLKNELISVVMRRSFWLTLILLPVISFIVLMVVSALQKSPEVSRAASPVLQMFAAPPGPTLEGYVDNSGLVKTLPPDNSDQLKAFPNQAEAERALQAGDIQAYYMISSDYLKSGQVTYVRLDYNPIGAIQHMSVIQQVLAYNLLYENMDLVERVEHPFNLEVVYLSDQPQRDPDNLLTFFMPYVVTILFYSIILNTSSLMLSSVTTEKQNRVMEILMTSVQPTQLLNGKIVALGLVGLFQTVIWSGAAYALLMLSGQRFSLPVSFQLPPQILLWGVLFFVLGYAVYGSLMAAIGALVPNLREASQATTVIMLPMIIPLVFIAVLIQKPNSAISIGLSLFPLTSPVTMMTRLTAGSVPLWQLLLAVLLLVLTAWFLLRATAGMFRAQTLLSGQEFKLKLLFMALIGKA
jgi:ABC-2 type transport system permease protein